MRYLIITILLLIPVSIFSQQSFSRVLSWEGVLAYNENIRSDNSSSRLKYALSFRGAVYNNQETFLPYYYELIPVNSENSSVQIVNLKYEQLTDNDLKNISHLDKIPTVLNFTPSINYDRKSPVIMLSFIPLIRDELTGKISRLRSFTIQLSTIQTNLKKSESPLKSTATQSALASGSWYKIKILKDGIYKLTYEQLVSIGVSDPATIRIHGFGGMLPEYNSIPHYDDLPELSIYMNKGGDGVFNAGDYILFYGKGPIQYIYDTIQQYYYHQQHSYSDASYYFITSGGSTAKTPITAPLVTDPETHNVTVYDYLVLHELNNENLIRSGREFYERIDDLLPYTISYNIPGIRTDEPSKIISRVIAKSTQTSSFSISVPGAPTIMLYTSSVSGYTYAFPAGSRVNFTPNAPNVSVNINFTNTDPSASAWLDYIMLNVRRDLSLIEEQVLFSDQKSRGWGNIGLFNISQCDGLTHVWDVSNSISPKIITTQLSGSVLTFKAKTDSLKNYVVFNSNSISLSPIIIGSSDVGVVANQNIHGQGHQDYIIVVNDKLLPYAEELAQLHRDNDNMNVLVVTTSQVYNEYSSGATDAGAIRNMMKMFYDRYTTPSEMPRYLMLFGDGSYDNKTLSEQNSNLIPTYQSGNSLSETSSFTTDDFYALLDDNEGGSTGLLDIGVGRLPVRSGVEAKVIIDKIKSYVSKSTMGDWRNMLCFIGDDEDNNLHMTDANRLAVFIDTTYPEFNISKIYLDAYKQVSSPVGQSYPEAVNAINNRVKNGALIINYTGHGGELGLAHEGIVGISQILSWDNYSKLPLFITASCEVSRWDDYKRSSAGEYILLNNKGGGIALLSTTRLVYATLNFILNNSFYKFAFERNTNGEHYRLGDLLRLMKNDAGSSDNKLNFSLLGDPALMLAIPDSTVETTNINGININIIPDTLKALAKITISGALRDRNGVLLNNFNGVVYPTVYDKESTVKTLANDGGSVFEYNSRNNVLYKGKASVTNGLFSFSFIVPKDIAYNYGFGKISYYAMSATKDYQGSYKNFIIGGTADSYYDDTEGPEIELFFNDRGFVPGGITNESPRLLSFLADESGINTVGNGIGHDISAVIDNNVTGKIVLNDYYISDMDSYKSGQLDYLLANLKEGNHQLSLTAWDVYNNSSELTIDFVVANSEKFTIKHLLNYPNPFTTNTGFYFEHNQLNSTLEVLIQIFTVSGKLVYTVRQDIFSLGNRVGPIVWDGRDDFGDRIGRGVYLYKLKVKSPKGETIEQLEKLVILR